MFDSQETLDMMAQAAKQQLQRQKEEFPEEGELGASPTSADEDIYKDLRQEVAQHDNNDIPQEYPEENVNRSIQRNPPTYEERPEISMKPGDEYYEERPQINPYDKPIFPGGPLQSQIDSWKKQFEGYDLFVSEILGQYFVFRTLNRFEYKQIVALQNTDPLIREEIICETVTLWPDNYDYRAMATDKAGLPSTLAQIVMEKSGFTREYGIQIL